MKCVSYLEVFDSPLRYFIVSILPMLSIPYFSLCQNHYIDLYFLIFLMLRLSSMIWTLEAHSILGIMILLH
jgi:hypothetical protein